MADRILGPAYPAVLGDGAVVFTASGETRGFVIGRPFDEHNADEFIVYWPSRDGKIGEALERAGDLAIDYADPHTRDRVCRALAAHFGLDPSFVAASPDRISPWLNAAGDARQGGLGCAAWTRPNVSRSHALRDLAHAVWGTK